MGDLARIKAEMVEAVVTPEGLERFYSVETWNKFEYLIALGEAALELLAPDARLVVEERARRVVLDNRDLMRAQRALVM